MKMLNLTPMGTVPAAGNGLFQASISSGDSPPKGEVTVPLGTVPAAGIGLFQASISSGDSPPKGYVPPRIRRKFVPSKTIR